MNNVKELKVWRLGYHSSSEKILFSGPWNSGLVVLATISINWVRRRLPLVVASVRLREVRRSCC